MFHWAGHGWQFGIPRVETEPLAGRVGIKVETDQQQAGHNTLQVQGGTQALLHQHFHDLVRRPLPDLCRDLHGTAHQLNKDLDVDRRLRGIVEPLHLGHLADLDLLFFDEPSAGLDPLSSRRLDELILELRASLGATIVVVTHELASIVTIGDNSVFLDAETRTMLAVGNPKTLRDTSPEPKIRAFLSRGEADTTTV